MANKKTKGITIELNGDTTALDKALSNVVKESVKIQSELKEVEKSLKFNPGNSELIAQKQQLLANQIETTSKKLNALKEAQSQVDEQFKNGKINEEQYRGFQRELVNTEGALNGLQGKLAAVAQEQQQLDSKTKQLQTLFAATGADVDRFADTLSVGLTNAIKSGNASIKQLDTAIDKVGQAALGSSIDVDKLKVALKSADDGSSLKDIKQDLSQIAKEANEAGNEVNGFGDKLTSIISGLAAGAGIGGIIEKSIDAASFKTKIDLTFDVSDESKKSILGAIKDIEAYGVDGQEALEGVRRQWALNKNASDEANASLVKQAATVSNAYAGIDFIELIQETNEVAAALNISNKEAIELTNALLKAGFPPEQLDTIAEYGKQMSDAGFSAKEIQAIFAAGVDTKTWNIDNLNDGVKEVRIQMATFGQEIPNAVRPLLEQAGLAEEKFQGWGKAVASGGEQGSKALSDMVTWLDSLENKALKNEIATKVFGTKWEDQGENMIAVFKGVGSAMDMTSQNATLLNSQMETLDSDPAIRMKQAISDITVSLTPLLVGVAELVSKVAQWASENPTLASTLTIIGTVLGIVAAAALALTPTILAMTTATAGFGIALNTAIWPITLIVAAIAALIAVGVLLYKNWDEIVAWCKEAWSKIYETIKSYLDMAKQIVMSVLDYWRNTFKNVLAFLKALVTGDFEGMKNAIKNQMENSKNLVSNILNAIKGFLKTLLGDSYNTVVEKFTGIVNATKEKMDNVFSTISEIWNSVLSFFKGIDLYQIGVDILNGLINGIKSMASKAAQTAKNIAKDVGDSIKGFFDIHSPSKLTAGYGVNIIQGLANGMDDSARQAVRSATNISSAVAEAMSFDASGMVAIATSGATQSASASTSTGGQTIVNFADMMRGANFVVRKDSDINLIAQQLGSVVTTNLRALGGA